MGDQKPEYLELIDSVAELRTELESILMQLEGVYGRCEELLVRVGEE